MCDSRQVLGCLEGSYAHCYATNAALTWLGNTHTSASYCFYIRVEDKLNKKYNVDTCNQSQSLPFAGGSALVDKSHTFGGTPISTGVSQTDSLWGLIVDKSQQLGVSDLVSPLYSFFPGPSWDHISTFIPWVPLTLKKL